MNLKLILKTLLILFIFTTSCEKVDSDLSKATNMEIFKPESHLTNWLQSSSNKWIPYLLEKAQKENQDSDTSKIVEVFSSYLHILYDTRSTFRQNLIQEQDLGLEESQEALNILYKTMHLAADSKLSEKGIMDRLWSYYLTLDKRKNQIGPYKPRLCINHSITGCKYFKFSHCAAVFNFTIALL